VRSLWRICRAPRASTAFDGEGARLSPGRWNRTGTPIAYCASSLSLATLEIFVHLDPADIPEEYVSIRAEIPVRLVEVLDPATLPSDWRATPSSDATREIGAKWTTELRSVALVVPSAITPSEQNVLLNPRHPEIRHLVVHPPERFAFDPRMAK
jgi:RES domain-containing protein